MTWYGPAFPSYHASGLPIWAELTTTIAVSAATMPSGFTV